MNAISASWCCLGRFSLGAFSHKMEGTFAVFSLYALSLCSALYFAIKRGRVLPTSGSKVALLLKLKGGKHYLPTPPANGLCPSLLKWKSANRTCAFEECNLQRQIIWSAHLPLKDAGLLWMFPQCLKLLTHTFGIYLERTHKYVVWGGNARWLGVLKSWFERV